MRRIAFVSAGIAFVSADTNANLTAKGNEILPLEVSKSNHNIIKVTDFIVA